MRKGQARPSAPKHTDQASALVSGNRYSVPGIGIGAIPSYRKTHTQYLALLVFRILNRPGLSIFRICMYRTEHGAGDKFGKINEIMN